MVVEVVAKVVLNGPDRVGALRERGTKMLILSGRWHTRHIVFSLWELSDDTLYSSSRELSDDTVTPYFRFLIYLNPPACCCVIERFSWGSLSSC